MIIFRFSLRGQRAQVPHEDGFWGVKRRPGLRKGLLCWTPQLGDYTTPSCACGYGVRTKPPAYLLKTQLFNFLGNMGHMSVKDENFPRAQGVLRGKPGDRRFQSMFPLAGATHFGYFFFLTHSHVVAKESLGLSGSACTSCTRGRTCTHEGCFPVFFSFQN